MAGSNKTDQLKLFLLNCNSLNPKLGEIKELIRSNLPDVFCFNETWLEKYIPKFNNYMAEWKHRNSSGGGVGIIINRALSYRPINLIPFKNGVLEAIAINLFVENCTIGILNIYNPNKNLTFEELLHYKNQLSKVHVIVGDFNGHSPILDDNKKSNFTGRTLEEFISTENINLVNPKNFYTYIDRRTGRQSCLDLCLTTPELTPLTSIIQKADMGSDHLVIQLTIDINPAKINIINTKKWKINNETLAKFSMDYIEPKIFKPNNIENLVNDLVERITLSAENNFKTLNPNKKLRTKLSAWWNDDTKKAVQERRRARKLLEKHPTKENLENYRKLHAKSKNINITTKRNFIKTYISSLTFDVPQSKVWKKIKTFKGNYNDNSLPIVSNGKIVINPIEKANLIADNLKVDNINLFNEQFCENKVKLKCAIPDNTGIGGSIEIEELMQSINELKVKAPGHDHVSNDMIKMLNMNYIEELLDVFNQSLITGIYPKSWKHSLISPILKPDKPKDQVKSYRPISLLPCLGKLLEKIVGKRLQYFIESHNLLAPYQSGFRPSKSTTDVLIQLETKIRQAFTNSQYCAVLYIDLQGAFDSVWHVGLLYKLSQMGITGNTLRWIKDYLKERTYQVIVDGHKSNVNKYSCGVPQGAVLSPILFNIMMADFPVTAKCNTFIFADDVTIECTHNSPLTVQNNLQVYVEEIVKWTKGWGLKINVNKTKLQYFTKKKVGPVQIRLENKVVEYVRTQRLLGVLFDSPYLTWNTHVNYLKTDCIRRISIMKTISSINHGSSFRVLKLFYSAYILSKLAYGASVLASMANVHLDKLKTIQNTCLRLMTGARKTSPVLSLRGRVRCYAPWVCILN